MRIAFSFLVLLSISSYALAKQDCLEERYVFDIGSGSTKSKAYLVDTCRDELVEVLGEINKPVKYQHCISSSSDKQTITDDCLKEGLGAVKAIETEYGIDCEQERCKGIATAWARNAKNSEDLLNSFKQEDVHINLISQKEEGELGFKAALIDPYLEGVEPHKLLVWDIGGGSFQLSGMNKGGELYTHEGPWGLFNFFQEVREKFPLKGAGISKERYFGKHELEGILKYASDRVGKQILKDKVIAEKLKTARVVGIGRIMYLGIKYELELENPITKQEVKELVYQFADITPKEAKKKYPKLPDHFVTLIQQALILVYGIMDGAGIDKIDIVNATLTDHLALDKDFWKGDFKVAQQSF